MKQLLDAYSIANTVRMVRAAKKSKTAVLVEGDKDVRLYTNLLDEVLCFITPATTKMNAVGALRLLRTSGVKGVIALIDADFSAIVGPSWDDPDIVTTDTHDLEGILLKSPALEKVIVEHAMAVDGLGADLRARLLAAARPLGYLRLASELRCHAINFGQFDFSQFIRPDITCDLQLMTSEAVLKSKNSRIPAEQMLQEIKELDDPKHDPWMIACGHDLTSALAVALSNRSANTVMNYTIERQLRLAYERSFFLTAPIRQKLLAWEQRNSPFRVLGA